MTESKISGAIKGERSGDVAAPIAVVHDDRNLRELIILTLRAAGHYAAGFDDPGQALEAIKADPRFRVLVTRFNFGSGKLNGVALARMLHLARPELKTVFVGRPENAEYAEGIGQFLLLPRNLHHLAHIVAGFLEQLGGKLSLAAVDGDEATAPVFPPDL